MKLIELTKGYSAILDDDDYIKYCNQKFHASITPDGYVYAKATIKRRSVYLHRLISGATNRTQVVDHINRNTLDNRKENLRLVTPTFNNMNQKTRKSSFKKHSSYRNVSYLGSDIHKNRQKKWHAKFKFNKKTISVGYFHTELEASNAVKIKYDEVFGKNHGYLNETN